MPNTEKRNHLIGVIMLAMTAIFWGAGFVLNAQLLNSTFSNTPSLLNALRFGVAAICLLAIFNKKIRLNKTILLFGGIGGVMLFAGFLLQLVGMKYTTPAHSGFFTASYVVFVPFIAWIFYKKRPHGAMFVGVTLAIVGLVILNLEGISDTASQTLVGDLITLGCAIIFALQIVWVDFAFKRTKVDHVQMTFWQVTFAALLFAAYTLIFESKHYATMQFNVDYNWWRLVIVALGGTAFAYFAQTYAQKYVNATETSLLLACESPIGAALSLLAAMDVFNWTIPVGGVLVLAAVILVEVAPRLTSLRRKGQTDEQPPDETAPSENTSNELNNNE